MQKHPVSEAKGRLCELIRRAEEGETILLTRHDKVVAEIRESLPERQYERVRSIREFLDLRKGRPMTNMSSLLDDIAELLGADTVIGDGL